MSIREETITTKAIYCDKVTGSDTGGDPIYCPSKALGPCIFCGQDFCGDHYSPWTESTMSVNRQPVLVCQDCVRGHSLQEVMQKTFTEACHVAQWDDFYNRQKAAQGLPPSLSRPRDFFSVM